MCRTRLRAAPPYHRLDRRAQVPVALREPFTVLTQFQPAVVAVVQGADAVQPPRGPLLLLGRDAVGGGFRAVGVGVVGNQLVGCVGLGLAAELAVAEVAEFGLGHGGRAAPSQLPSFTRIAHWGRLKREELRNPHP
ncbi:MAG: hypothetical protein HYS12_02940 [Planctomycetes bacterium]|nr:hypothetical protein [Planctomycetota bacterium]